MPGTGRALRVDVWHSVLWSRYKGEVFSELYRIGGARQLDTRFFQIAETDNIRSALCDVDLSCHRYPYALLFRGSYDDVSTLKRVMAVVRESVASDADLTVIAGYDKPDHWAQLFLALLMRKKVMVCCDSTIFDNKQRFIRGLLKRVFFFAVNGVLCYGTRARDYAVHYGADPARAFQPCQAAALPQDYCPDRAFADRVAQAPSPAAPRYLYVGRLSSEKGLGILLSAFASVREQQPLATLVLVGGGPDQAGLHAQAVQLGLQDSVIFSGGKSGTALAHEYTGSTCLVLPSTSEPWGLVVNEALSYGCPVIVSYICGCVPELVVEGQTGFSHRPGQADDLADKMMLAPAHFADSATTARRCLDLVGKYTPDAAAGHIFNGIKNVLEDHGRH